MVERTDRHDFIEEKASRNQYKLALIYLYRDAQLVFSQIIFSL